MSVALREVVLGATRFCGAVRGCDAFSNRKSRGQVRQGLTMSKKLLLDVDCGVDDAQAIMLAVAAPGTTIMGITCVHGNTTVENVCKNTLRVLQACNKLEVPVFKGAAKPILGNNINAGHFHGEDGLGDAPDPTLRVWTCFRRKTPSRGNTTVCGEFNFTADPEAAYVVLSDYDCPTYLACWEFTCYSKLSWVRLPLKTQVHDGVKLLIHLLCVSQEFCDAWLSQDSAKARFMARIFHHSRELSQSEGFEQVFIVGGGLVSCDSYAMAAAVDDSFVVESRLLSGQRGADGHAHQRHDGRGHRGLPEESSQGFHHQEGGHGEVRADDDGRFEMTRFTPFFDL
ncbi:putative uridine nucleosidase 2 [Nibea albiflora]|uniref:Uridine nucleosidase 2 n=1 Tax=Nibea albiflora TaxID=240163 RepID=A0ACB7EFI4_NIBAL|nr:putative uridine nucleosidase 2 [Nibea albiflora]